VGLTKTEAAQVLATGNSVPVPLYVTALVDAGCETTAVDPLIAQDLGLVTVGIGSTITPSTGQQPHYSPLYRIALALNDPAMKVNAQELTVIEAELDFNGFQVLLGRDVLRECVLIYDGPGKAFLLTY
jgi:hypothetical protein